MRQVDGSSRERKMEMGKRTRENVIRVTRIDGLREPPPEEPWCLSPRRPELRGHALKLNFHPNSIRKFREIRADGSCPGTRNIENGKMTTCEFLHHFTPRFDYQKARRQKFWVPSHRARFIVDNGIHGWGVAQESTRSLDGMINCRAARLETRETRNIFRLAASNGTASPLWFDYRQVWFENS